MKQKLTILKIIFFFFFVFYVKKVKGFFFQNIFIFTRKLITREVMQFCQFLFIKNINFIYFPKWLNFCPERKHPNYFLAFRRFTVCLVSLVILYLMNKVSKSSCITFRLIAYFRRLTTESLNLSFLVSVTLKCHQDMNY